MPICWIGWRIARLFCVGITMHNNELYRLAEEMGRNMRTVQRFAVQVGQDMRELRALMQAENNPTEPPEPTDPTLSHSASYYMDPYLANQQPLALPLPQAFVWAHQILLQHADKDHLIVAVSAPDLSTFYARTLGVAQDYPDFLHTAVNLQEQLQMTAQPVTAAHELIPIAAPANTAPLQHWLNQYQMVFSAVLIQQYPAGGLT